MILVAPPGAGKTTRVPLALLEQDFLKAQTIKVIEPRRLAAKTAAERMASSLLEDVGQTVGYQVRLERRLSKATRIELVTDGVFRRQILEDPELSGTGIVLFDEFHERSMDTDFCFALVQDVQTALREDLRVLIMSATIDAADLSERLGNAPVIRSEGRMHPVKTNYLTRAANVGLEDHMASVVLDTIRSEPGSILCFLPGQREISRTAERLADKLPGHVVLHRLAGTLDRKVQDEAIRPATKGIRKVVLATAIAETSLTIEGVRVVIDSGLSRIARFDPGSQITRLETVRAPLSSIDQRRGRAGRTEPGLCLRLWHEGQTGSLPAKPDPEIRQADLSQMVLDLAAWGVVDPTNLPWLDPPPKEAWSEAVILLQRIKALAVDGTITAHGRTLGTFPLHPRLGTMIMESARLGLSAGHAAEIAALLSEPGLAGRDVDFQDRLRAFRSKKSPAASALRRQAANWAKSAANLQKNQENTSESDAGVMLAFAYPDRVGQSRGREGAFKLANGKGCVIDAAEPLSQSPYIVVADVTGKAANARVQLAASIGLPDILRFLGSQTKQRDRVTFDEVRQAAIASSADMLGALVLKQAIRPAAAGDTTTDLLLNELAKRGFGCLPFDTPVEDFCARLGFLRTEGFPDLPDLAPEALLSNLSEWFAPFCAGITSFKDLDASMIVNALELHVGHGVAGQIARAAPLRFDLPAGNSARIDYLRDGGPGISVRPNEVFGPAPHPTIANGQYPLAVTLLSPANRPLQVTRDLPGFWAGSWKEVRAELRARYPRHFWPEDPSREAPRTSSIKRK